MRGLPESAASAPPDVEQRPVSPPFWTSTPQKVDPAAQGYARLPSESKIDPYPLTLIVPTAVRTSDSATFSTQEGAFRLANIERTPPDEICKEASGMRWACGLRRRMALRSKLAGRVFRCRIIVAEPGLKTIECLDGDKLLDVTVAPPGD